MVVSNIFSVHPYLGIHDPFGLVQPPTRKAPKNTEANFGFISMASPVALERRIVLWPCPLANVITPQ